jgi:hypothetical protein
VVEFNRGHDILGDGKHKRCDFKGLMGSLSIPGAVGVLGICEKI